MPPHPEFIALLGGALLAACAVTPSTELAPAQAAQPVPEVQAADQAPCVLDGAGVYFVASQDPARPRVRYADGQVGLADHCAIRVANGLNRRIPPVYVNGRPIGFC